jgi:hypothetical protein
VFLRQALKELRMQQEKQLEQIAGIERVITVRGHEVKVREVKMKELRAFTSACSPFLRAFDESGELAVRDGKKPEDFALFKVLTEHCESFMEAAALVSNANVEFFEKLRPDEFFEIAALVVEVNGDFFVRALAPALIRFAKGVSQIGSTLASGLSPQAMEQLMSPSTASEPSTVS